MTFHSTDGLSPVAPGVRRALEDEIERLIAMLDACDHDPDIELNGDELDASYPNGGCRGLPYPQEDAEDGADTEPSLGSALDLNGRADQRFWCDGVRDDREHNAADDREHEDEHGGDVQDEPHDAEEKEPLLGWAETYGQTGVGTDDMEASDGNDDDSSGLKADGSGIAFAKDLLRLAAPRCLTLEHPVAERDHALPVGGTMRVFVSAWTGCVVRL